MNNNRIFIENVLTLSPVLLAYSSFAVSPFTDKPAPKRNACPNRHVYGLSDYSGTYASSTSSAERQAFSAVLPRQLLFANVCLGPRHSYCIHSLHGTSWAFSRGTISRIRRYLKLQQQLSLRQRHARGLKLDSCRSIGETGNHVVFIRRARKCDMYVHEEEAATLVTRLLSKTLREGTWNEALRVRPEQTIE